MDDSDFEEEHFINDLSSEDEEDIVLPLELYNIRRQQRIRDDFSISSSPLPARHNVRTRWVGVIVPSHFQIIRPGAAQWTAQSCIDTPS